MANDDTKRIGDNATPAKKPYEAPALLESGTFELEPDRSPYGLFYHWMQRGGRYP
jgi:hypothetical protein